MRGLRADGTPYTAIIRRRCRYLQLIGVSRKLRRSASHLASICSANFAVAAPHLAGKAGQKKKAMQGAGPCMTLKPLARPDRRMISPPRIPLSTTRSIRLRLPEIQV